jgi:hypothetical protein
MRPFYLHFLSTTEKFNTDINGEGTTLLMPLNTNKKTGRARLQSYR